MDGAVTTVDQKARVASMRGLAAILLVLAIAGCAIAPVDSEVDYPPSFPKLARPVGTCPAVGGSISNRGERHNPVTGLVEPAIFGRDVLGLPHLFGDADVLRLTFEQAAVPGLFGPMKVNVLHIASDSGSDWRTPADRSICYEGVFQYVVKDAAVFSPIGLGVSSDAIKFVGAGDGSLIVKQGHQDSGTVVVVPYKVTSTTSYYRFPVVPDTATRRP
jgi:hypothetical protein